MQNPHSVLPKLLAAVTLIAAGIFFFVPREPQPIVDHAKDDKEGHMNSNAQLNSVGDDTIQNKDSNEMLASYSKEYDAPIAPELTQRLAAMQARRPSQPYDPDDVAAAVDRTDGWHPTDTVHRELPLAEDEFSDGRQFIQLDSLKIETLMPGDLVNVRVAEKARDYQVVIDRIEKHDYNSISWYGHIEGDDGHKYQVSFTRGEQLTVGGLDTPDGHFVLQALGEKGWIASSQLLFKADTSTSDAINPADVDPDYKHPHQHP